MYGLDCKGVVEILCFDQRENEVHYQKKSDRDVENVHINSEHQVINYAALDTRFRSFSVSFQGQKLGS